MSYSKRNTYPSIKTPGVYRNVTDKKLGLDYDDLENLLDIVGNIIYSKCRQVYNNEI